MTAQTPPIRLDGAACIAAERYRQIAREGRTPDLDDCHTAGELAQAAATYITRGAGSRFPHHGKPQDWPWDFAFWKPKNRRADLVRAGALLAAEIDRLDRLDQHGTVRDAAPQLLEALVGLLDHTGIADAGADMKDESDHVAERRARAAIAAAMGIAQS